MVLEMEKAEVMERAKVDGQTWARKLGLAEGEVRSLKEQVEEMRRKEQERLDYNQNKGKGKGKGDKAVVS